MSLTEEEKQAKAERKAAKKAKKAAQALEGQTTDTVVLPEESSKKRKAEAVEGDKVSKKVKASLPEDAAVPASADLPSTDVDTKAAKKARKEAKRLAKAQAGETGPAPTAGIAAPIASASASDVEAFLAEHDISYDPPAAATSTYPPVLSFDALTISEGLKKGLTKFTKPTPVQSSAWGVLFRERDCIAIAETGSGKTMAFGLPAIKFIEGLPAPKKSKKSHNASITVLVVAPTRELAMQTEVVLAELGKPLSISSVCIYGGVPKEAQKQLLAQSNTRIVVGTPGRIIDLCNEGALDLSTVSYLVLDEADRMLDKGFENDIRTIISSCAPSAERHTMMFSATWPMSVRQLANDFMKDPIRITVGSDELTASLSVEQKVTVLEDGRMKDGELIKVLNKEGYRPGASGQKGAQRDKVLVFALYKKEATRVERFLQMKGYQVACIQGDMHQTARTKALEDFKTGNVNMLVATDVAARGLDVPKVELVVNYTFPLTIEDYIHRIGRTGRAGRKGKAHTFFTADDKPHSGELQRVLKDAGQDVPEALQAFGGTIRKKVHPVFGAHYDESLAGKKGTKITF